MKPKIILAILIIVLIATASCSGTVKGDFSYSEIFNEKGYLIGTKASDIVKAFDYSKLQIPYSVHNVTNEQIHEEIKTILEYYGTADKIYDRAVAGGDKENIDYVGSVDGVEFSGGSTEGTGADVTAGSAEYVDDFLSQIIGHIPGETINVEVTFPEDYGSDDLNGREALFVTTINYIHGSGTLTDDFVKKNLNDTHGWTNVEEAVNGIHDYLQKSALYQYLYEVIADYASGVIKESKIPKNVSSYYDRVTINYFKEEAASYGETLEDFLVIYAGVDDETALLKEHKENNMRDAMASIAFLSLAESSKIEITETDMVNYFKDTAMVTDYSMYIDYYGLPYIKKTVLQHRVMDIMLQRATYLDY